MKPSRLGRKDLMKVRDILTARQHRGEFPSRGRAPLQQPALPPQSTPSRQEAEEFPPAYRTLYEAMVNQMPENMHLVDQWLCDSHPALWQRIRDLDDELARLEQQEVPEVAYKEKLNEMVTLCHEGKALREGKWQALLVKSELLGCEIWVLKDDAALALVKDDERPIFFVDELEKLKGKSPDQIQDILKAKAVFPGCRVVQ